jgi:hypothetical protein
MANREGCPNCGEPLVAGAPGDTCSKCGSDIVERSAHSADDADEKNVIDGERVAVPPERY